MLLKILLLHILATLVSAGIEPQLNVYRHGATRYTQTTAKPQGQYVFLESKPRTAPVYHSSQQYEPALQRVQLEQPEHGQERALTREELVQLHYQQQEQHQQQLQQHQQLQHQQQKMQQHQQHLQQQQQLQLQQQLQQHQQLQLEEQEIQKQQGQSQDGGGVKRHQVVKLPKSGLVLSQSGSEESSQQADKDVVQALRSVEEAEVKASIGILEVEKALKKSQLNELRQQEAAVLQQLEGGVHGLKVTQQGLVQPEVSQHGYGSEGIQALLQANHGFSGVRETLRPNDDERKVKAELYKTLKDNKGFGLRLSAANQLQEWGKKDEGQGQHKLQEQRGQEDEKLSQLRGQLNQQARLEGQLHQQGQLEDQLYEQGHGGQLELQLQQGHSGQGPELQERLRQQLKYGAQLREQRKEQAEFQQQLQQQAELEQQRNEQRQREYATQLHQQQQQQQQQQQGAQQQGRQIEVQQLQLQGQSQHSARVQSQPIIIQQLPQLQVLQIHQGQLGGQLQEAKPQDTGKLQGLHGGQLQEAQLQQIGQTGQLHELLLQQGGKLEEAQHQGQHGAQLQEAQHQGQHGAQLQEAQYQLGQHGAPLQEAQYQLGQHGAPLQEAQHQGAQLQEAQYQGQHGAQLQEDQHQGQHGAQLQEAEHQGQHVTQLQEAQQLSQHGAQIQEAEHQGQHGAQIQEAQHQGQHGAQIQEAQDQGVQIQELLQPGGKLQELQLHGQQRGPLRGQHGGQFQEQILQRGGKLQQVQLQGQHGGHLQEITHQEGGQLQQVQLQGQHGGHLQEITHQEGGQLQPGQLVQLQQLLLQEQLNKLQVQLHGQGNFVQLRVPVKLPEVIQVQQIAQEEPREQVKVKIEEGVQEDHDLSGAGQEQIEEQEVVLDEGHGKGHVETVHGPRPYAFKYRSPVDKHGESYHEEKSDHENRRVGSYGYKSADGLFRHVDYVADKHGFRAQIRSNEPGLSPENPAGVKIVLHDSPRFLQQDQERHSNEPGSYAQEVRYQGHK